VITRYRAGGGWTHQPPDGDFRSAQSLAGAFLKRLQTSYPGTHATAFIQRIERWLPFLDVTRRLGKTSFSSSYVALFVLSYEPGKTLKVKIGVRVKTPV